MHRIEFTLDRPRTHDEMMVGRTLEALIRRKDGMEKITRSK